MNAIQAAVSREAHRLALEVLSGKLLTDEELRLAELSFRSVLRFAANDRNHRDSLTLLLQIEDALAHLKGQSVMTAGGGHG